MQIYEQTKKRERETGALRGAGRAIEGDQLKVHAIRKTMDIHRLDRRSRAGVGLERRQCSGSTSPFNIPVRETN